jgi:hypothetical protein
VLSQTLDFMTRAVRPDLIAARRVAVVRARTAAATFSEDWPSAVAGYTTLIAENPKDPELHQRLGEALLAQKDPQRAIVELERSLELGTPNRGLRMFALVRAHIRGSVRSIRRSRLEKLKPFLRFFGQRLRTTLLWPHFARIRASARSWGSRLQRFQRHRHTSNHLPRSTTS